MEHRGKPAGLADRTEGGDGRLPTPRIDVPDRDLRQRADDARTLRLPERRRGTHDHEGVVVAQAAAQCIEHRGITRGLPRLESAGAAADLGCGIVQCGDAGSRGEGTTPGRRTDRPGPHLGVGVREGIGQLGPLCVAGEHDLARPPRYRVPIDTHGSSEPRRGRALTLVAVVIVVVLAGFVIWATKTETDHWAITPGVAQPVGPLITVDGHHTTTGRSVFLTDVYVSQLTVWQWLLAEIHPVNEQLIQTSELTGDTPSAQFDDQGYLQMYDSRNDAKAAAMRALHLDVTGAPDGATVVATIDGSPAVNAVGVGDRIVAVDGRRITDACGVAGVLDGVQPGSIIVLRIVPATISQVGDFSFGAERDVRIRAGTVPAGEGATNCPNAPRATAGLGVELEDSIDWQFPVQVSINTRDIGGPSAGLAMTLGIIEALSKTSLTGHLRIAATGTIDPQGQIGDVGGVAEKAIAVVRAGATVFFVPGVEVGAANSTERANLRVIGVSSLSQVLADLRKLTGEPSGPIVDTSSRRRTS